MNNPDNLYKPVYQSISLEEAIELMTDEQLEQLPLDMPKSDKTKRVEAHLLPEIVEQLQKLAKAANRSLKNYIETLLIEHVKEQKKK